MATQSGAGENTAKRLGVAKKTLYSRRLDQHKSKGSKALPSKEKGASRALESLSPHQEAASRFRIKRSNKGLIEFIDSGGA